MGATVFGMFALPWAPYLFFNGATSRNLERATNGIKFSAY